MNISSGSSPKENKMKAVGILLEEVKSELEENVQQQSAATTTTAKGS